MRVFEHFGSGQDGRAEVVQVAQAFPEFPAGLFPPPGLQLLFQFAPVLAARGRGRKSGIFDEAIPVHEMRELGPHRVAHVGHAEREVAVGDFTR